MRPLEKSIASALSGLKRVWKEERNFKIESTIGALVVLIAIVLRLSRIDMIVVLLVVSMVLMLEMLNTLLERFVDIAKPRLHNYVEIIKDTMAAVVLTASIASVIIGILIFYPYITEILLS
jgi:diacylglycerol kinase